MGVRRTKHGRDRSQVRATTHPTSPSALTSTDQYPRLVSAVQACLALEVIRLSSPPETSNRSRRSTLSRTTPDSISCSPTSLTLETPPTQGRSVNRCPGSRRCLGGQRWYWRQNDSSGGRVRLSLPSGSPSTVTSVLVQRRGNNPSIRNQRVRRHGRYSSRGAARKRSSPQEADPRRIR